MLPLVFSQLSSRSCSYLQKWQRQVTRKRIFQKRVDEACRLWPQKNTRRNLTFREIRQNLMAPSGPLERCQYCGRAEANQIEHIQPKAFYPEATFVWENLLWVCDKCNLHKGESFSIYQGGQQVKLQISTLQNSRQAPPVGNPVFFNLRQENPLPFLHLDFQTGKLISRATLGTIDNDRMEYTLQLLGLSKRDGLNHSRKQALHDYYRALKCYVQSNPPKSPVATQIAKKEIQNMAYPIVWAEMKRQQHLHPKLQQLFAQAPEALNW